MGRNRLWWKRKYHLWIKNGNGTIKEYGEYRGKRLLLYEGTYLQGKLNGHVKSYYLDGTLKFEGEYLNGKKHGKGKEYDFEGNLVFEGEYLEREKIEE